jgi:hypothetical protein
LNFIWNAFKTRPDPMMNRPTEAMAREIVRVTVRCRSARTTYRDGVVDAAVAAAMSAGPGRAWVHAIIDTLKDHEIPS